MKKSNVYISIAASTGCGKTSLALLLKGVLEEAGFDVSVDDLDLNSDPALESTMAFTQDRRIEELSHKVEVHVATLPLNRAYSK